jgi:hypothetical protein
MGAKQVLSTLPLAEGEGGSDDPMKDLLVNQGQKTHIRKNRKKKGPIDRALSLKFRQINQLSTTAASATGAGYTLTFLRPLA